jgi:hypothetical protein
MSGNKLRKLSRNAYEMAKCLSVCMEGEPLGEVLDAFAVSAAYRLCTYGGTEAERGERVEEFVRMFRGIIVVSDEMYGSEDVGAKLDAMIWAEGTTKQ